MKKLTVLQWIALLSAVVGMIMETGILGDSILVSQIASKVLVVLGILKFAYDQYQSFSSEDMVKFAKASRGLRGESHLQSWIEDNK